jgi:hypothetical protein
MFVSDHLVYLQLQKTACTHIAEVLNAIVDGDRSDWGKHQRLPASLDISERAVVGSIRNPWDWYVSLWAYGCAGRGGVHRTLTTLEPHRAFTQAFRHPTRAATYIRHELTKPTDAWESLYADPSDPELFQSWLHRVLETDYAIQVREAYASHPISRFAGLFTHRFVEFTTSRPSSYRSSSGLRTLEDLREFDRRHSVLDETIRVESLESDLIRIVEAAGHELSPEEKRRVTERSPSNTSERREAAYYYDDRARELVRLRESLIIEKYGYEFPG